MAEALKLCLVILSCVVYTKADVAHLGGYRRYNSQRGQPLRLQRLESVPTAYPAAGYRPNREFSLPSEQQPLFPLASQPSNRPEVSSGFDILSEPQRPQLTYGSPVQEPRFRPGNNGFNNLDENQEHEFLDQSQFSRANQQPQQHFSGGTQQPQNNKRDFNTLSEPQQPELLYGAPDEQEQVSQSGFDSLSEPQYNNNLRSARLRQQLIARLQRSQRFEQSPSQSQKQQVFHSPQTLYSAPFQQLQLQQQRTQAQSESKTRRLIAAKPARLIDTREEIEEVSDAKGSETVEDIETTTKAESRNTVNHVVNTPVVANTGVVSYYPATAFSFVQPLNGAYIASSNYQTVQPVSAAYTVGSAFLPQQYALAAGAPAQLQAW